MDSKFYVWEAQQTRKINNSFWRTSTTEKSQLGKRDKECIWDNQVPLFGKMSFEDLSMKVTLKQRPKGGLGNSYDCILGVGLGEVLLGGSSKYKGPEAGQYLIYFI